jgi:hypothetical protein
LFEADAVVRTAVWSLLPLAACRGDDSGLDATASGSTTVAQTDTSSTQEAGDDSPVETSAADTTASADTTTVADTTTATDTTISGDESSSTTEASDDASDTLVDGCWQRSFYGGYYGGYEPPWEPFACASLPNPCDEAVIAVSGDELDMTPEEIVAADAAARCIIQGIRDGEPAFYRLTFTEDSGVLDQHTRYFVLPEGTLASISEWNDLSFQASDVYRQPRDPAFFDACLAETELLALEDCLANGAALDPDACIDGEPQCAE